VELTELKSAILKLLKEDEEFRYTIAGYLGILEILKRLDTIAEEQRELRKEQIELREEQKKIWEEIRGLREEQTKIWEEIKSIKEEQKGLREEQIKLREEQIKLREEQIKLREEQKKIWEEIAKVWKEIEKLREEQASLREDFNRTFQAFEKRFEVIERRLTRVERTLEKLTVDVEDEARSIIRYRLRTELGLDVELTPLTLPDLEINIYGVIGDVCVIGEATVRAGASILYSLLDKIESLRSKYSDKVRPKIIAVIYASLALPELVEEARKRNVWVLKAIQDYYKPDLTKLLKQA